MGLIEGPSACGIAYADVQRMFNEAAQMNRPPSHHQSPVFTL